MDQSNRADVHPCGVGVSHNPTDSIGDCEDRKSSKGGQKMKQKSPTKEAREFVGSGNLRQVLEIHARISPEAIDKIIQATCFVLKA